MCLESWIHVSDIGLVQSLLSFAETEEKLSNTLDNIFCLKALERALELGKPEVFNTEHGVQFTSRSFTENLESAGVKISMDGRGRVFDNIFIERLWRTVKYEDIYLKNYTTVMELNRGLDQYFRFYNNERFHQSLDFLFAQAFSKSLITGRQLRSIMIVKELQMDNDPPYFGLFLVLILGVTIVTC
jgi:transposase InsO family protein